ncbi:MAG: ABC transporter ATP-binding protein, partial [Accumulibacter sp.]
AGVDPKARRDFWEEIHRLSTAGITILVSTHYMDEAERCHRLAYIAYGSLLATGTASEIVASCRLNTWEVSGDGIHRLAEELRGMAGVDQVASFGATLHVSGQDGACLQASLQTLSQASAVRIAAVTPSLEDAFIHLMQNAQDPFAG